jgi:hypothetical protein
VAGEHAIPELDRKGLRSFAFTTGGIVAILFGLFFPWVLERPWPRWPWIVVAVLVVLAIAAPMALRPVYRTWMRLGLLMSKVTTPLILGIVFYGVVSPVGLFRRALGRSSIPRSFDKALQTYRVPSANNPATKLERPF